MSTVGTLTRLAGTAIGRTAHAVRHPVESAAFAAGLARGTAGAVVSGVRRHAAHEDSTAPDAGAATPAGDAGTTTAPAAPRDAAPEAPRAAPRTR